MPFNYSAKQSIKWTQKLTNNLLSLNAAPEKHASLYFNVIIK